MGETILTTRRRFLSTVSSGAIGSLIAARTGNLEGILDAASVQDRRITFEESLKDEGGRKGLRQKYLEQLVKDSPYGKYINNVVYDHDFSQAIKSATDLERIWNNPRLLEEELNEALFLNDPAYSRLDAKKRSEQRKNYLASSENRNEFNGYLVRRNKPLVEYIKTRSAIVLGSPFGTKTKPTLYVFGDSFEQATLPSLKGPIRVLPSESRILVTLAHEFVHVEDEFNGILDINPAITSKNYLDVHPEVFEFVKEIRGYLKGIETATRLENPNKGYLMTNDFEKLPPAYFLATQALRQYIVGKEQTLIPDKLSFQDKGYVVNQLLEIRKRAPEMLIQPDVNRFSRSFGIQ
ncbi:MAG: hypothetical protein AABX25_03145 [Nanoarchaeota archaeon]